MPEKVPLWLTFADKSLENAFQQHYDKRFRAFAVGGIALGAVAFSAFGLLDRAVFPDAWKTLWLWRYLFCLPILLATLAALLVGSGYRWVQPLMAVSTSLVGLGTLGMFLGQAPTSYGYFYSGLMLVIFYVHAFVRLRFAWASLSTLVLFIANEAVAVLAGDRIPWDQLLGGQFFLVAAVVGGMGASYSLERDARAQFLLQRKLTQEQGRLEELNDKLEDLALLDELTGVGNRRNFMEQLNRAWRERSGPVSLLLLDIDHFKNYNDQYGHPAGDRCLQRVAKVLAGFARRPRDLAARIGGEEFVLLLPEADMDAAMRIAESLRREMEKSTAEKGENGTPGVTVSIGVASRKPLVTVPPDTLLKEADRALYRAKREGRNRVVAAG